MKLAEVYTDFIYENEKNKKSQYIIVIPSLRHGNFFVLLLPRQWARALFKLDYILLPSSRIELWANPGQPYIYIFPDTFLQ